MFFTLSVIFLFCCFWVKLSNKASVLRLNPCWTLWHMGMEGRTTCQKVHSFKYLNIFIFHHKSWFHLGNNGVFPHGESDCILECTVPKLYWHGLIRVIIWLLMQRRFSCIIQSRWNRLILMWQIRRAGKSTVQPFKRRFKDILKSHNNFDHWRFYKKKDN